LQGWRPSETGAIRRFEVSIAVDGLELHVLDEDAIPLTRAVATSGEQVGRVRLEELSAPGALLDYYFGRGKRMVMLQDESGLTLGTVDTTWEQTERRWEVWLEPSAVPSERAALAGTAAGRHEYV
jgi:hypothetical protein